MNELVKLTGGGTSLSTQKKQDLAAMQRRLGIVIQPKTIFGQSNIRRVVLLFDATESMNSVWQSARSNIRKLIERQRELTPQAQIILVAYRDYCDGDQALQVFQPSADTEQLLGFLNSVKCDGGGDLPEAVELALEQLLQLKPDLAILVGDAPPHGVIDQIVDARDYRQIARRLGESNIPVYTISTNNDRRTVSSFQEIATLTNGNFFLLDQVKDLIDLLSVVTAKKASMLDQLAVIFKRENGGMLTAGQQQLLLQAGKP